jgi:glycosyltransferase involved in cell wall biosynthesis
VRFLGFRGDVEACLRAFDVFVHAPRSEAFGLVVAEAMAAGVPVLATRVGGIPEIITEGETGRLVAPESPGALALGLRDLIGSAARRRELGGRGREVAIKRFSVGLQSERYARLYADVCAGEAPIQENYLAIPGCDEAPFSERRIPCQQT